VKARWFLVIGIAIGALVAVVRLLVSPPERPLAGSEEEAPPVIGTRLFEGVFDHVRTFAVDSLDAEELYRRAAAGVIEELDDPYAVLVMPGQPVGSLDSASPQGMFLDRRNGVAVVVATVPGSPAAVAGVLAGDQLLAVDSIPIDVSHLARGARLLAGEPGTTTTLRIRRSGQRGILSLDVIRGPGPEVAPVVATLLPGQIGLVELQRFVPDAPDSIRAGIERLRRQGARALVLDLRGTVGGALRQGAAVADLFLGPRHTLAVSRGRPGAPSDTLADSSVSPFDSIPMAVLVDAGTAGAGEVVAGALQDHDRAAVLGDTTFGRGVTQSTYQLSEGISLQLTTALWITPSGRQIQRPPNSPADSAPAPRTRSDAGRPLSGGGGIVPDRVVSDSGPNDPILAAARRLLLRASTARAVLGLVSEP
jgi:carboxyl-terminal processing protease